MVFENGFCNISFSSNFRITITVLEKKYFDSVSRRFCKSYENIPYRPAAATACLNIHRLHHVIPIIIIYVLWLLRIRIGYAYKRRKTDFPFVVRESRS